VLGGERRENRFARAVHLHRLEPEALPPGASCAPDLLDDSFVCLGERGGGGVLGDEG